MQRNEINEVEEAFSEGKLGSSTMPHKRNPVAAENLAGLGRPLRYNAAMMLESMVQEGERDGISWKIEWKVIPETCLITAAMLSQSCALFAGLKVNADAMTKNLHLLEGYLLSERVMLVLSERVGKQTAHKWIYQASMNGLSNQLSFLDALKNHAELSDVLTENELKDLTNPADYLGQCEKDTETIVKNATWA